MDPLRHRFYINGEDTAGLDLHDPYLQPAAVLLGQLKADLARQGLTQGIRRHVTPEGATLTAMSRFGQDEVRVDVPYRSTTRPTTKQETVPPEYAMGPRLLIADKANTLWTMSPAGHFSRVGPIPSPADQIDWIAAATGTYVVCNRYIDSNSASTVYFFLDTQAQVRNAFPGDWSNPVKGLGKDIYLIESAMVSDADGLLWPDVQTLGRYNSQGVRQGGAPRPAWGGIVYQQVGFSISPNGDQTFLRKEITEVRTDPVAITYDRMGETVSSVTFPLEYPTEPDIQHPKVFGVATDNDSVFILLQITTARETLDHVNKIRTLEEDRFHCEIWRQGKDGTGLTKVPLPKGYVYDNWPCDICYLAPDLYVAIPYRPPTWEWNPEPTVPSIYTSFDHYWDASNDYWIPANEFDSNTMVDGGQFGGKILVVGYRTWGWTDPYWDTHAVDPRPGVILKYGTDLGLKAIYPIPAAMDGPYRLAPIPGQAIDPANLPEQPR